MIKNYNNNIVSNKPVGLQAGPHYVTNGQDFDTPLGYSDKDYIFPEAELPKGYQSTASVELIFYVNGQEVKPDQVCWSIESVQNNALAWNRERGAFNGLAWGDSEIDGGTNWEATPVIGGPFITTSSGTIKLTDVVGERIVTLKAETTINGVPITETIDVSFGKGPLSVFVKPPSTGGMSWATANRIAIIDKLNDFTASSTTFPAATFCGGTVHTVTSEITIGGNGPDSYTADFSGGIISGHWRYGDKYPNQYYSITSKLPTIGQLVAVSTFNEQNCDVANIKPKGAAMAAGWHCGWYWTGQVYLCADGYFYADFVDLAVGGEDGYGYVTGATPVVVCVS
jgi:hypothetical protein